MFFVANKTIAVTSPEAVCPLIFVRVGFLGKLHEVDVIYIRVGGLNELPGGCLTLHQLWVWALDNFR